MFFHYVLEGLRGGAKDDEGEVTFAALAGYVSKRVAKDVPVRVGEGAKQSPTLKTDYSTEPVLVRLSSGGGAVPKVDPLPRKDPPAVVGKEPKPGDEIDIEIAAGVKMRFCWVPQGEFWMGAADGEEDAQNNEKPQRRVRITKGFWMGKHEVTQAEYEAVTGKNPSHFARTATARRRSRG